jgi:hypothetical protein
MGVELRVLYCTQIGMSERGKRGGSMSMVMTIEEIERDFQDEWVLVADPVYNEQMEVVSGRVLGHSRKKEDLYRQDDELRPRSAAYLYTGPTPENVLINL